MDCLGQPEGIVIIIIGDFHFKPLEIDVLAIKQLLLEFFEPLVTNVEGVVKDYGL